MSDEDKIVTSLDELDDEPKAGAPSERFFRPPTFWYAYDVLTQRTSFLMPMTGVVGRNSERFPDMSNFLMNALNTFSAPAEMGSMYAPIWTMPKADYETFSKFIYDFGTAVSAASELMNVVVMTYYYAVLRATVGEAAAKRWANASNLKEYQKVMQTALIELLRGVDDNGTAINQMLCLLEEDHVAMDGSDTGDFDVPEVYPGDLGEQGSGNWEQDGGPDGDWDGPWETGG